jgi:hypothetical protein
MSKADEASVSVSLSQHLRMALSEYAGLPAPGEEWIVADTDLDASQINAMASRGVIHVVDRRSPGDDRRVWRTDRTAWAEIQRRREEFGLLACGHRPFRTVDLDSERPYSCLGNGCDARYTRAEIEAVIDGE